MNILILCAHTDDEVGCSGTVVRMLERRNNVKITFFSKIKQSLEQEKKPWDTAVKECKDSINTLNINYSDYYIYDYPVRNLPIWRQPILEKMCAFNRQFKPHMVFVPATTDRHQDHQVVCQEAIRAFKFSSILGYELPQNIIEAKNTAYIKLKKHHIQKKIDAMSCYKSQSHKMFMQRDFIWSLATIRGVQCGADYAESFEVIRMVI